MQFAKQMADDIVDDDIQLTDEDEEEISAQEVIEFCSFKQQQQKLY